MTVKLKPYQQDAIKKIKQTFKKESRQYVVMPTGSGKTFTFLYQSLKYQKTLVIVPSKTLLHQVYESAKKFYDASEISRKGDRFNEFPKRLHIVVINSLRKSYAKRMADHSFDLVIVDEAHHSQADTYKDFICLANTEKRKFLGVTATPDRLDGKLLDQIFYVKSYELRIDDMIEQGFLSDVEGLTVRTNIDLKDVGFNSDFSTTLLYQRLSTDSRNSLIVNSYLDHLTDRKTLIFCINIKHSKEITKLLQNKNVKAAHIDGKMSKEVKEDILKKFRSGEIEVLCNCQLLTEGFDEPSIDGLIVSRPTKSRSLFIQMLGRGLRLYPRKKNCKVIDIADNHNYTSGFNAIITDEKIEKPPYFKGLKDLKYHVEKCFIETSEMEYHDTNFFKKSRPIEENYPPASFLENLRERGIEFYEPIYTDEATFLLWKDLLKEEYNGEHQKN